MASSTNYIRLCQNDWATPVYRFTTIDRLLQAVIHRKNTLVAPKKWEDPFEDYLGKVVFRKSDGTTFRFPFRNSAYAQCWTLTAETDSAWRMYLPHGGGVRLESTVRGLHQSLIKTQETYASMSSFIGRVEYKAQDELNALFADKHWIREHFLESGTEGHAESLLFKRIEFKPEREIRLIFLEPHNNSLGDTFSYSCDPNEFIKSVVFDHRMENDVCEAYTSILKQFGYSGRIDKSSLYMPPRMEIDV